MSKNSTKGYIVLGIIFVVFTVIAFAAPFTKTGCFAMAYIFGIVSIAFQIYVFKISFTADGDAKSKFYGFPIAKVGVLYLVAQLIASLLELILAEVLPAWVALIVNVILLALAAIGCIAADVMRNEIERQDIQLKKDVSNMRALQSMSAALVGMCDNDEYKKSLQDLADEFKYSDPVTSDSTSELESDLKQQLSDLQSAITEEDFSSLKVMCNKINAVLKERNRICALNK